MARVIHFDMFAKDPARAKKFYEQAFGWEFKKWDGPSDYWLIMTGPQDVPGIDGGMSIREKSDDALNCTIEVDSIDKCLENVKDAGGTVIGQKMAIPGVGWMAYFKDTEDNVFGLMENDTSAK